MIKKGGILDIVILFRIKTMKQAPYGTWKSPITSDLIVSKSIGLGSATFDSGYTYWTELRPMEGGRIVVVQQGHDGAEATITPEEFNVRNKVHEYGGAPYVIHNGCIYFSHFSDDRLYKQKIGEELVELTHETGLR